MYLLFSRLYASQVDVIKVLVTHGAAINFEAQSYDTALIVAAQTGNLEVRLAARMIQNSSATIPATSSQGGII